MKTFNWSRFYGFVFLFHFFIFSIALSYAADPGKDLREAAEKGDIPKIRDLIAEGVDVNSVDGDGRNALFKTAEKDHSFTINLLVDEGINVNAADKDDQIALHIASEKGRISSIRALVEAGSDVNHRDRDGRTPIYLALKNKRFRAARMLINAGADPQISDKDGETSQSLLDKNAADADSDLLDAAKDGNLEKFFNAMDKGADVNARHDDTQKTPLHLAAEKGRFEIVRTLIEMGSDIDAKDVDGNTAQILADNNEHLVIGQLLQRTDLISTLRNSANEAGRFYGCEARPYLNEKDGGESDEKLEFYELDPETVKKLLIDSMMVVGFAMNEDEGLTFEGHREYMYLGGGGAGGERIYFSLEESELNGKKGTLVTARTRKTRFIGRGNQRVFTRNILDQVNCLAGLLSLNEPIDSDSIDEDLNNIMLVDGTPVPLRLKHYLFSEGLKEGETLELVASNDVVVDGVTIIQKGAPAQGKVTLADQSKMAGRGAKIDFIVETVQGANGENIKLRSTRESNKGIGTGVAGILGGSGYGFYIAGGIGAVTFAAILIFSHGGEIGIRAGTQIITYIDNSGG